MDKELLRQLLLCLNKKAFSRFIYELWDLNTYSTDKGFKKVRVRNNYFEQHLAKWSETPSAYDFQAYDLIVPFFMPLELLLKTQDISFIEPTLRNSLKRYSKKIDDRKGSWFFPVDGQYIESNIAFVTNFSGIDKDTYVDQIIPKFQKLLEEINLDGIAHVGSIDSFLELEFDKTLMAFKNFMLKYDNEVSISANEDKVSIDKFYSDKYITKGTSKKSNSPYESIYITPSYSKSEILLEFENLINSRASENTLERFLTQYYKEIFGERYDRIETQLWLRFPELDIAGSNRRIDLFLRNAVDRDWELFELKKSQKLTRTYRDVPTFTNEIFHAIQQIRNYENILKQEKVKQKFYEEGIEYYYPELRLVIGNRPDISTEQWRWLKTTNENKLKIITFEDLISEMRMRYNIHTKPININE